MAKSETTISVTEVTFVHGKTKSIRVKLDGNYVNIPVDETVYAYFNEQFLRTNPTALQKKKFATIMNVLRAAYQKGKADGKKEQS